MNGKDLFMELGNISPKYFEEAEHGTFPSARKGRPFLIAAVIAMMLLLTGCAVAYVLHMQDLKVGDDQLTTPVFNEYLEFQGNETIHQQVLTIAGVKGSPGYLAAQEWFAFEKAYDPDYAIADSLRGNYPEYPHQYDAYGPYTQEMVDKLDEIAAKYNLKLQGPKLDIHLGRRLYPELGIKSILMPDSGAVADIGSVTGFEGGSLYINHFTMKMPKEEGQWPNSMLLSLNYSRKDCLDTRFIYLDDTNDWQEWTYATASGQKVLMMMSPSQYIGWIVYDREDAVISVRVPVRDDVNYSENGKNWVESTYMTRWQFEQVADAIDFSMTPSYQGPVPRLSNGLDPTATVQTQNGCTIEVKSAKTDGYAAKILLGVTLPEGTVTEEMDPRDYNINLSGSGYGYLTPRTEGVEGGNYSDRRLEDGDGNPNTFDILIEAQPHRMDNAAAFRESPVWDLYIEELVGSRWDEEYSEWTEETIVEGVWNFELNFEGSDFREIELVSEPVTAKACIGWKYDGTNVYEDVEISSFRLRSLSAAIIDNSDSADYTDGQQVFIVMRDGSRVELQGCNGLIYLTASPIDASQVDHVLLGDGTKLPAAE